VLTLLVNPKYLATSSEKNSLTSSTSISGFISVSPPNVGETPSIFSRVIALVVSVLNKSGTDWGLVLIFKAITPTSPVLTVPQNFLSSPLGVSKTISLDPGECGLL